MVPAFVLRLWGFAFLVTPAAGFSKGAPDGACLSMFPGHGIAASDDAAPYEITLSNSTYSLGDVITVTLSGNSSASTHRGVFLQARRANCAGDRNDAPIGTFALEADMLEFYQLKNCGGVNESAITHRNNSDKTVFISTWTAPVHDEGPIYFRATVLKNFTQFWTSVTSDIINGPSCARAGTPTKCPAQTQPAPTQPAPRPTTFKPETTTSGAAFTWRFSAYLVVSSFFTIFLFA